jgi:hypothetical protein
MGEWQQGSQVVREMKDLRPFLQRIKIIPGLMPNLLTFVFVKRLSLHPMYLCGVVVVRRGGNCKIDCHNRAA